MRKIMMATALALGTASITIPAAAQTVQVPAGLVNVTVGDVVLNRIASDNDIDVNVLRNALNNNQIALPISVAAAVCNVPVNVLASQKNTTFADGCTASNENGDFTQLTRILQKRGGKAQ
jgi:hypothetical protein